LARRLAARVRRARGGAGQRALRRRVRASRHPSTSSLVGGRPLTAYAVGILTMSTLRGRTTAVGCGLSDFGALGCYKKNIAHRGRCNELDSTKAAKGIYRKPYTVLAFATLHVEGSGSGHGRQKARSKSFPRNPCKNPGTTGIQQRTSLRPTDREEGPRDVADVIRRLRRCLRRGRWRLPLRRVAWRGRGLAPAPPAPLTRGRFLGGPRSGRPDVARVSSDLLLLPTSPALSRGRIGGRQGARRLLVAQVSRGGDRRVPHEEDNLPLPV